MSHVFLRLSEVKKRTGKAKTTIYREINEGKFPKQDVEIIEKKEKIEL